MHFTTKAVYLIRASITRPNIHYAIINMDRVLVQTLTVSAIVKVISWYIAGLLGVLGKVIIYYYKREITNSLSKSLYYKAYYSKVIDKEGILKRFIFNNNRTIITINALSLGLNIPNINTILYIKALKSLKNYT